ncbi:MAG: purine biosynthesis protein PurH [Oscillibacter sp.]|nr:purine biosynthesis protein PurH [Oscillibacter sp.]
MQSIFIQDTTRSERVKIVENTLRSQARDEKVTDTRKISQGKTIYQPYIDGRREMAEINAEYHLPLEE